MPVLRLIWLELIFPSRRIWAGLAVVWILILAVNFSMQDHPGGTLAKATTPEIILSSPQEEQLLTELIEPNGTPVAEPKKPYAPRPSSLRAFEIMSA